MTINTNRRYTADDIAALTALQAEASLLDAECREVWGEFDALLKSRNADWIGWEKYAEQLGLAPLAEAIDPDKYSFATANTSYIPQVGHYWNSKWNPTMWAQRNRRTRRDIAHFRKAIAACEVVNV